MPKKYKQSYPTKPASTAHPSLTASVFQHGGARGTADARGDTVESVNNMLSRLRSTGESVSSSSILAELAPSTLDEPTWLLPPTQPQPALTPRERMLARAGARRVPGPPPPASWTRRRRMLSPLSADQLEADARANARKFDRLPDLRMPAENSLVYQLLKKIAINWIPVAVTEGAGLSLLPVHLKKYLLALLVVYGPGLILLHDVEAMFHNDDELSGATGAGGITHVHAAFLTNPAVGPIRGYKDLAAFLFGNQYLQAKRIGQQQASSQADVPDSWEDEIPSASRGGAMQMTSPTQHIRFAAMTHLDLSQAPYASWKHLLRDITPHLKQLTHLSLAYWPAPSRAALSRTTVLCSASGGLDGRVLNWYNTGQKDWSENILILQKLGKDLPRLKWLDLEGCSSAGGWIDALRNDSGRKVDWAGTFRGLETIKIGQGSLPAQLERHKTLARLIYWASWVVIDRRDTPLIDDWISSFDARITQRLKVFDSSFNKDAKQWADQRSLKAIRELWLWLEREHRVYRTCSHIKAVRSEAGVPNELKVVSSSAPGWVDMLIDHPERGQLVDETMDVGLHILRKIFPSDTMRSIPDCVMSIVLAGPTV